MNRARGFRRSNSEPPTGAEPAPADPVSTSTGGGNVVPPTPPTPPDPQAVPAPPAPPAPPAVSPPPPEVVVDDWIEQPGAPDPRPMPTPVWDAPPENLPTVLPTETMLPAGAASGDLLPGTPATRSATRRRASRRRFWRGFGAVGAVVVLFVGLAVLSDAWSGDQPPSEVDVAGAQVTRGDGSGSGSSTNGGSGSGSSNGGSGSKSGSGSSNGGSGSKSGSGSSNGGSGSKSGSGSNGGSGSKGGSGNTSTTTRPRTTTTTVAEDDPEDHPNDFLTLQPGTCQLNEEEELYLSTGTIRNSAGVELVADLEVTWIDDTGDIDSTNEFVWVPANGTATWEFEADLFDLPVGQLRCSAVLL